MSSTIIKAVWSGDRAEDLERLHNSHGSAPVIWGDMSARYIGGNRFQYPEHIEPLWALWKRMDIPKYQRAVLIMTYDNAYVSKENYRRAAMDIRAWLEDFPQPEGCANHWPRIAEIFESDLNVPAIGFRWTTVSEDPFKGLWNEDSEDYDPPDWSKYWEIYPVLDDLDRKEVE